jgi:hypothetical protein
MMANVRVYKGNRQQATRNKQKAMGNSQWAISNGQWATRIMHDLK